MDRDRVSDWLEKYRQAWLTYDPQAIGDLFSEDALYRYHPHDEPLRGRDAIVASWLEEPDVAGTYDGAYGPIAVDGDVAVAVGHSIYRGADGSIERVYDNCFVMRFDAGGRCGDFTEWFMKRAEPPGA